MKTVYLSIGVNLGDRFAALKEAVHQLHQSDLRIKRISSVYETSPTDVAGQPWFLNIVVQAETTLFPMRLLSRVSDIQRKMGRGRKAGKGPRVIDIDILLHGNSIVDTPQLTIPHPRLHLRRFVLQPLAELAPDLRHPAMRRSVRDLFDSVPAGQIVRKLEQEIEIPAESGPVNPA